MIEIEIVERLFEMVAIPHWSIRRSCFDPTDDAALVDFESGEHAVLSTDMLMDGVDFVRSDHDRWSVEGMAVNLSDIAAMGAKPKYALVSLSIPYSWSAADTQKLMEGILGIARNYGAHVVGGDTTAGSIHWPSVSLPLGPWPWERLGVGREALGIASSTGPCGGSILGRHLEFSPRIPRLTG